MTNLIVIYKYNQCDHWMIIPKYMAPNLTQSFIVLGIKWLTVNNSLCILIGCVEEFIINYLFFIKNSILIYINMSSLLGYNTYKIFVSIVLQVCIKFDSLFESQSLQILLDWLLLVAVISYAKIRPQSKIICYRGNGKFYAIHFFIYFFLTTRHRWRAILQKLHIFPKHIKRPQTKTVN